jgi:hypothetical protein
MIATGDPLPAMRKEIAAKGKRVYVALPSPFEKGGLRGISPEISKSPVPPLLKGANSFLPGLRSKRVEERDGCRP